MSPLTLVLIAAIGVFLLGNIYRAVRIARMPEHLRWDLYPIPKGPRERQRYGGSYFEETEWWTKPMEGGRRGGLAVMLQEALLLRGVYENFRALWLWSLLLHWGIYLYLGLAAAVIVASRVSASLQTDVLQAAPAGCMAGCACGAVGSVGLLLTRTSNPRLSAYTSRATIFNLCLFAAMFGTGLVALFPLPHSEWTVVLLQVGNWGHLAQAPSPIVVCHFALAAFFLAYFPFTHMTHMFMKYFTWHCVRWDDTPARFDEATQEAIAANLERRVSWRAPHVGAAGQSWAEVASSNGRPGSEKRA